MARLPVVGSDANAWGTVLNAYLSVAHNSDGSIKNLFANVKDPAYGAVGDGITDDTTAIANARSAVNAAGGGIIFYPPGTYLTGNQTLYSKVHDLGSGIEATIIKLKNGANTDLFSANTGSINLSAASGTGSTGGVEQFSIKNMTLDGNKANQSSGPSYPLRFYGYAFTLDDLRIRNGFTGNILIDWNGGTNATDFATVNNNESMICNTIIHDCNGIGLEMGGPHDSLLSNVLIYDTASHNLHFAPNALAMLCSQMHCYSSTHGNNALAYLLEATQCCFINCEAEGSDVVEVAMLANGIVWTGGRIFTSGISASGIQIGQAAGNTPYPGMILQSAGVTTAVATNGCQINCDIASCEGANGSLWFANDGGNLIIADVFNATGSYTGGTRNASTGLILHGRGLTADGTIAKSGGTILNGTSLRSGTIGVTKSASVQSLANNNTITTLGVGQARVTSTGAVTGIILQAGSFDGQIVVVDNQGANSVTFDVSGTSHVRGGTSVVIAANTNRMFIYDTTGSLWN